MRLRLRITKRRFIFFGVLFALLIAGAPLLAHRYLVPIQFNQFLIERADATYGITGIASRWQRLRSAYSSGVKAIARGSDRSQPDLDDPDSVLAHVLSWAPPYSIVYPTEIFYYFGFRDAKDRWVWGNLRIAEAGSGRLGLSFFHPGSSSYTHKMYDSADGVTISSIGDRDHVVKFRYSSVRFHVPDVVTVSPASLSLDTDEKYVSRIVDECGVRFHLVFNCTTNSFYMLLDESDGIPDRLAHTESGLVLGSRTGFVYYDESASERRMLIGVHLPNIAENNYFDGPGDQVPYEVPLRDLLHLAYPHTMLGPGIDAHGVLQGTTEWQRIAITPFQRYQTLDEVNDRITEAERFENLSMQRTSMTKEWWNSPMWVAMKTYELRAEGKSLIGTSPGLLSLEELESRYPESMFMYPRDESRTDSDLHSRPERAKEYDP